MDALKLRRRALLKCLAFLISLRGAAETAEAASFQTVNFAVTADRADIAEQVGQAAEVYRRQLAIFWLGKPLPNWSRPCKVSVREGTVGAGGQTTFQFSRGEVLNWRMQVQGTLERILDSVLPHEINHTIFACHFRRPLPRWADEGAATLFEHRSEQLKQLGLLNEVVRNKSELISLRDLLSMKEYPKGQRPMLTLYAQGYALADFLVQQKGRHAYLKFISDGERGGWEQAIRANFDHDGIESLERNWRGWVLAGMPKLTLPREQMLAAEASPEAQPQETARPEILTADAAQTAFLYPSRRSQGESTIRLQSPDPVPSPSAVHSASQSVKRRSLPAKAVSDDARTESPGAPRRSSFEAPKPRPAESSRSAVKRHVEEPSAMLFRDSTGRDYPTSDESSSSFSKSDEDRLFGMTAPADSSDILALTEDLHQATGQSHERNNSNSFEFSGVLLPAERHVRSGSTPQWAGFPGQKKLF